MKSLFNIAACALIACALSACNTIGGGQPPGGGSVISGPNVDALLERADGYLIFADVAISAAEGSGVLSAERAASAREKVDLARKAVVAIRAARAVGNAEGSAAKAEELRKLLAEIARLTGRAPPAEIAAFIDGRTPTSAFA